MKVQASLPYSHKASGLGWLGEIPAHWEVWKVGHLLQLRSGDTLSSEQLDANGSYPVYGGNGLRGRFTKYNHAGDYILIGRQGALCGNINYAHGEFWATEHALVVYPRRHLNLNWLGEALRHMDLNQYSVSAAQPGLSVSNITCLRMPVPPCSEQDGIAKFLDYETAKIDALIEKQQQLIALLEERRTALLTHAVTRGFDRAAALEPTGRADFRMLPPGWQFKKLRRLLRRLIRPVTVDRNALYREIGVRSWGKGVFHKEPLRGAQLENKKVFHVHPGDLVFNIVFAWEGAVAVLSECEDGMIASHRFPTFDHDASQVELDYLLMLFQTAHGRKLMSLNSPGAAGRNKTLRIGSFLEEEIPLPPVDKQRAIVAQSRADEARLIALAGKAGEQIDLLQERRTALISAAVTGKIDVREWQPPVRETEAEVA